MWVSTHYNLLYYCVSHSSRNYYGVYDVCTYETGIPSTCIVQQQSDYIGMALILCARVTRLSATTILTIIL